MKTKRIISWFLILTMMITFIPSFGITGTKVGAASQTAPLALTGPEILQSDTKENVNQSGGIIYTKTSEAKSDGTVDITLTAHTTGVVKPVNIITPTDIVLVLDMSGSMKESFTTTTSEYVKEIGSEYTYWSGLRRRTGYGFDDDKYNDFYINLGTNSEPVYAEVSYTGQRDANGFEIYRYTEGTTTMNIYPVLSGTLDVERVNAEYPIIQFYSLEVTRTSQNKLTALKDAVKTFIDTTYQMNSTIEDTSSIHSISIVKFAGPHYSNNTTDTPTIVTGNGTYTYSGERGVNYSQVVKGLTPVDDDGAAELKSAVDSLNAAGSTAVDKGLALAEAVLKNRALTDSGNAANRNQAVIVFTDGDPNHQTGFSTSVANDAISIASRLENTADVTIYGVCIATNADENDTSANINKFMHYMSSNYPNATSMTSPGEGGSSANGYYKTPDDSHSLSMIFDAIIHDIDHPTVSLGEEATVVDTLSPYFSFVNGNATNITLMTSARKADGTWAAPVDDANLTYKIEEDRLTVDGFDFDANFVSETGRGTNGDFYGKRLVITFTVVPNYDKIDEDSAILINGDIPTNESFATINDSDEFEVAQVVTPELEAFQVVYEVDGEEHVSYNRFTGSSVIVDDAPIKEGYTFSGWEYPNGLAVSGGSFTMPQSDVKVVGKFTVNTHNVSYVYSTTPPSGASALPTAQNHDYGTTVTVAPHATAPGYIFSGWTPQQTDVNVVNGEFTMPDKNVVLIGHFIPSTATPYKVEHYLETLTDGVYEENPEITEPFSGTTGHTVSATPLNRFSGFTYNDTKSAATKSGTITGDGNLVLKLYYDRNEYKVEYGYEGDTEIAGLPALPAGGTFKYGETVTVASAAIPPAGYSFTGWYRGTVSNPVSGTFEMPAYDVHLLGYFEANTGTKYTVEHYLMNTDGTYPSAPEDFETFYGTTGHTVLATPLVKYQGFTYDDAKSAATKSGEIAGDGSLVLKLYYSRNKYNVVYQYERTIPDNPPAKPVTKLYYYGVTVDLEDNVSLEGYTFSGWHTHDTEGVVVIENGSFEMPMRDVNIYGYFTANTNTKYTVEHYLETMTDGVYELGPYKTQEFEGTTGTEITAIATAVDGFTYNDAKSASTKSGIITGDGELVLKLYYDRNEYKVEYGYEGDTSITGIPALPASSTYKYGETVTVEPVETAPDGYTFVGWYRGTSANIVVGTFEMPAHDITLLGYFMPNTATEYTVEHYLMDIDGTYPSTPEDSETLYATTGHTVEAKPGTEYVGFTYDDAKSAATKSGVVLGDGSLVLKLYYARNKYEVSYEYRRNIPTGAPTLPATKSYYYGEDVSIAPNPTLAGYTFSKWHVHDSEGSVSVNNNAFEMPARDVVLYGYFEANTDTAYRIEHYIANADNTGYNTTPYRYQNFSGVTGESVTGIPLTIEGFTYNDADSAATKSGTIAGDGSLVLKLYYSRNKYKVTYKYEGDLGGFTPPALPAEKEYYYGQIVTAEAKPFVTGYTFHGWYKGTVSNTVIEPFEMPARDVELLGNFQPGENTPYEVHHYLETLTDGVYETTPAVNERLTATTGHTVRATVLNRFIGFTYNDNAPGKKAEGVVTADGKLVLKLYYDRNEYNVTYGYDGDIPASASALPVGGKYKYGEKVTVAAKATASGYIFHGWYRGTPDNLVSASFDMPAYDVHILGNFTASTNTPYAVEHYLEKLGGGYELDTSDKRYATTGDVVSAINKEYVGFTYNEGISTPRGTVRGDGKLVLAFYYDRNKYNVSYVYEVAPPAGAPALPAPQNNIAYGKTVNIAAKAKLAGYTFNGWTTEDVSVLGNSFEMPSKNVVFKGSFTANTVEYKVNYWFQKVNAGNSFNKADYELDSANSYTDTAKVGAHVEAKALSHTGFYVNAANSNPYGHVTVDSNGNGNLVLNVYFDRHTYNVSYVYYGNQPAAAPDVSVNNKTNVRYGTKLTVAADPTLQDYVFDGWYTHTANVANGEYTMPAHNVEFIGMFVRQYSVEYDLNGGTGAVGVDYSSKKVDTGTVITVNPAPNRDGYVFKGWVEGKNSFNPGDDVTVDRNIVFVAKWSPVGGNTVRYKLTYVTNGGNYIPSEKYPSGRNVTLVKVPVRNGYAFEGWYLDEALTESVTAVKMTKDITVYAKWVDDNGGAGHGHTTPEDLNGDEHFAYVVGYEDGTVRPGSYITRAEVTTIFFRLLKEEIRDKNLTSENTFSDVPKSKWYNISISTMAKLGVVNGKYLNLFAPDEFITRAEFAVICARFDNSEFEVDDNFVDVKGHWAEAEIHEAAAHGWIRGYDDNTFKPDALITRAEAMTMINRVLNRVPETKEDLLEGMIEWPDNSDKSAWYYLIVQEATNSHKYDMKNHIYEKWTVLQPVADWAKYQ